MIDGVQQLLSFLTTDSLPDAYAGIVGKVLAVSGPVQGRIYKNILPRGVVLPAVVLHRYGRTWDQDLTGPVDVAEYQVQVDVYGATADAAQALQDAIETLFVGYVGPLPDGTSVLNVYLERSMDMPFLGNADQKGITHRALSGFRFVVSQ